MSQFHNACRTYLCRKIGRQSHVSLLAGLVEEQNLDAGFSSADPIPSLAAFLHAAQGALDLGFHPGMHVHEGSDLRDDRLAGRDRHAQDLHVVAGDAPLLAAGGFGNLRCEGRYVPDKVGLEGIKDFLLFLRERNGLCRKVGGVRIIVIVLFDCHVCWSGVVWCGVVRFLLF